MTETVDASQVETKSVYPKIRSVYVTNFMSLKQAEVHFDDSGIIKILGYNNSGKSAILRALAVTLLHRWKSSHKQFIRDDARYFQVDVAFDDGVVIRFEKHATGTSLYEMYGDDGKELLFTTKISEGNYQKITEVPEQIATYLGILSTPDGINLAYGVNTDKQLLVETTGSENYQALNVVLKSEEISRAVSMLNSENNQTSGKINNAEARIMGVNDELYKLHDLTEPLIKGMNAYDAQVTAQEQSVQAHSDAWLAVNAVASVPDIPEVPVVNTATVEKIYEVGQGVNNLAAIEDIPEVPTLDTGCVHSLQGIAQDIEALEGIADIPEIPHIVDTGARVQNIEGIITQVEGIAAMLEDSSKLEAAKTEVDAEIAQVVNELRDAGHVLTQCPGCGQIHLADVA